MARTLKSAIVTAAQDGDPMTLDQIKTFLWVSRLGGFRRAAEQLHLSQPAVSSRIAALEDRLQVALFERGPKGMALTRHGAMLTTYAEQMLFVQDEILARISNPEEMVGLFRVGVSETIAQTWLPAFLKSFARTYPRISIDLTVDISHDLRAALLERRLDVAMLMGPISDFSVENVALPQVPLHWYKPAGHGEVDFAATPVMSYSARTRPHRELTAALSRRVGPGARIFSSSTLSASLRMIAEGIAVGPFPRALAQPLIAAGRIEEFDPGMDLSPLTFTASHLADPQDFVAARAAAMARTVALASELDAPAVR